MQLWFTKKNYPHLSDTQRARLNLEWYNLFMSDEVENFTDKDYDKPNPFISKLRSN